MKRQIKFRGKRVDTGEWVIGCLVGYHQAYYDGNSNRVCIHSGILTTTEVLSDTVGQFTGLLDKNSREIYEHDIVTWTDSDGNHRIDVVKWVNGGLCLCNVQYTVGNYGGLEGIGNIHDNPELLKGGKECKY
ncbi:MAG: hypothetical protein GY755_13555 [Chloroflexi bacterium]|nr:hypothetical protein [Chloroflexota bacterium]